MRKTLVMLALSTVSIAPVFAGAPATNQTQPQQQTPSQQTPAKPVEMKKLAGQAVAGQADDKKTPVTPATPATAKPKLVLVADEKPCNCPTDKKDMSADKKDGQKTPAPTPAKATPPKVALA